MFHPAVSLQYIASTWRDNKKEKNNQTDAEKKAFHPEGSGSGGVEILWSGVPGCRGYAVDVYSNHCQREGPNVDNHALRFAFMYTQCFRFVAHGSQAHPTSFARRCRRIRLTAATALVGLVLLRDVDASSVSPTKLDGLLGLGLRVDETRLDVPGHGQRPRMDTPNEGLRGPSCSASRTQTNAHERPTAHRNSPSKCEEGLLDALVGLG